MKRAVLFGWCIVSLGLWALGGNLLARVLVHISFEIPSWLANAITTGLRAIYTDYQANDLDVEAATELLLVIGAYLLAAVIVVFLSVAAWRRFACSHFATGS